MTWDWFTSQVLALLLILGAVGLLFFGVFLLFLTVASTFVCHILGWRELSATIWLWFSRVALFACFLVIWGIVAFGVDIVAVILPTPRARAVEVGVVLLWLAALGLVLAFTGWAWPKLWRRTEATLGRAQAQYLQAT
jgi:uncharacterized membrane protein